MAGPVVPPIEALRMHSFHVAKRLAQVSLVILDDQVDVVRHQAIGVEVTAKPISGLG